MSARPVIDADRLLGRIGELARVGADPQGGVTRLAWSGADREAVALVGGWAAAAGAAVRTDAVGTLVADRPGAEPDRAPLAIGSHLDTVVRAGPLDGAYGVVVAVEIMAALADAGTTLRHPLRAAAFANEEGVVAPPFTGSRAAAGDDLAGELDHAGPDGVTLRRRLEDAGCHPSAAPAAWPPLAGYLEVHIEQGPVLDAAGCRLGVVSAVTGQTRAAVAIAGQANHAGTTPMALRRDALVAAAHGVLAVERLAVDGLVAAATVGRLSVEPGVPNVVPGLARFTVDVRSVDSAATAAAMARLEEELHAVAARTGTSVEVVVTSSSAPVATAPWWRALLGAACSAAGSDPVTLPSGAGHDAGHLARLGPIGMLFVPSIGGRSHDPGERTADADLVLGARVALDAVLAADAAGGPDA